MGGWQVCNGRLGSSLAEPASSAQLNIALCARGLLRQTSSEDGHVRYLKYGGVAEDAREARYRRTHACTYMYVFAIRVLIRLVAMATIRERRLCLFRSALAQVCDYYSRAAFFRERRLFGHIRYSLLFTVRVMEGLPKEPDKHCTPPYLSK